MTTLADHPELGFRMGAAGRRRVIAHFDWEEKVDRMLEIYDHAIECWNAEHAA